MAGMATTVVAMGIRGMAGMTTTVRGMGMVAGMIMMAGLGVVGR
ncbi:hypothetical protein SAMN02800694_0942 [Luteibacter sp. UNCMF331Sha3.1]|nr:hypothetical protein SAMN02800694_0942 [Luteibacter sp. UNCMF331Sha3.1]